MRNSDLSGYTFSSSFSSFEESEDKYFVDLDKKKQSRRKGIISKGIKLNKYYLSDILQKGVNITKIFQDIRPDKVKKKRIGYTLADYKADNKKKVTFNPPADEHPKDAK